MTAESTFQTPPNQDLKASIALRATQIFVTLLVQALVLFLAAGTLRWWAGWAYIGLYLSIIAVNAVFMLRLNPETIAERGRGTTAGNWQAWDKVVGLAFALFYFFGILLVAGLDERFSWTGGLTTALQIAALGFFALGLGLFSWAMIANAYFSTAVRIQEERSHAVCSTGPYRFVRHPGYGGAIVQSLAAPLLLGSLWALIPGGLAVVMLLIRTALEDRTLRHELPGYAEYSRSTRYRLLPGLW